MKKIKLIVICSILIMCSGCTLDYNIIMRRDHTIDENVVFKDSKNNYNLNEYSMEEIVDSKIESYYDEIEKSGFKINKDISSDGVNVSLYRKNQLISRFTKLSYFQRMFNTAEIEEKNGKYSFKTTGVYNQSGMFYDLSGITDEGYFDNINLNIQFENKVISCNGDSFNEYTNTCTWNLDKNTTEKSIEFVLSDEIIDGIVPKDKIRINDNLLIVITVISVALFIIIIMVILNKRRNDF